MANYEMDEVFESPVSTEEVTGQEEAKTESTNVEVLEESGETSTEEVKEEVKQDDIKAEDDKTTDTKKEVKSSDQFTTLTGALKAAENLAITLREDVDFSKLTLDQVKEWYNVNRPRVGTEGFKGDRSKAKQLNATIKSEDKLTRLESKLDNFLEAQQPKKNEPEVKPLAAPIEPEFDEETYNDLVLEEPKEAAKMMREYRKAQNEYINQRIEFEGARLGQALKPIVDGYTRLSQKEQEAEREKVASKEWETAETIVEKFVREQGDGDFKDHKELMNKLAKENFATYKGIIEEDGKERAIFKLYQDAKREKQEVDKEIRLARLEAELAALKNGETLDQINATKGAARITQTNGGITPKTPQKPKTQQEIFEDQMRGNTHTRSKYDIEI